MNAGHIQPKTKILRIFPLFAAIWLASSALHAQAYEGKWHRTYLQFTVDVSHWGENCGTRPRSYSSKATKPTEILQNNGHLFFSTGGLRTDRCNSPNPALISLTTSRSANMWTRTCETPADSGRYEKIDYTFSGSGDQLTYRAESSFRWSLDGDLCVVKWVERRTYARVIQDEEAEAEDQSGSPVVRVHKDDSFAKSKTKAKPTATANASADDTEPRPECNPHGKAKRLVIAPRSARISPSQSVCFQLRGVDENECRFPVAAKWTASQNGVVQPRLMNAKGCFVAGDNAAESEGIFQVLAEYRGVSAQTTVEVKYPDIGDLALARLDLSDEIDGLSTDSDAPAPAEIIPIAIDTADTEVGTSTVPGTKTPPLKSPEKSSDKTNWIVWLLAAAIVVFIVLSVVLTVVLVKKPRATPEDDEKFFGELSEPDESTAVPPPKAEQGENRTNKAPGRICLKCGKIYPADAKFCPVDATSLVSSAPQAPDNFRSSMPPPRGMICPKCKRGYDMDARFCPHDSTALVEYHNWRKPS